MVQCVLSWRDIFRTNYMDVYVHMEVRDENLSFCDSLSQFSWYVSSRREGRLVILGEGRESGTKICNLVHP